MKFEVKNNNYYEKAYSIVSELLNIPEGTLRDNLSLAEDLAIDSLDLVEMVMSLEEKLGVNIDGVELSPLRTIGDLIQHIVDALAAQDTTRGCLLEDIDKDTTGC